jgi:hypothetical protein
MATVFRSEDHYDTVGFVVAHADSAESFPVPLSFILSLSLSGFQLAVYNARACSRSCADSCASLPATRDTDT